MDSIINLFGNHGDIVAVVTFIVVVLTAVKQLLVKLEERDAPAWLKTLIKVLRKILELITANDSQ